MGDQVRPLAEVVAGIPDGADLAHGGDRRTIGMISARASDPAVRPPPTAEGVRWVRQDIDPRGLWLQAKVG